METPWINAGLYPFQSRYLELEGHKMHYIDEGAGPVILFSHGTPEWSFGWRDVVRGLRDRFRCIAPDLLGFGLSDKPTDVDYSVAAHARRMTLFIEKLGLRDFHIVGNDFGLSIAFDYAIRHPENVQKLSLFNGWMWPLDTDPHYARPARWMQSWLGRLLYLRFNFPVNLIMPAAFGDKKKLTPEVHRHYKMVLPRPVDRKAAYAFSGELLNASGFWADQWRQVHVLADKPCLIFWGMRDSFVPPYELEKWEKALPNASVIRFENAGHFVQEEEPECMVAELAGHFGGA
ncbi:MAG: alpha/beta fold hydrolase [Lewinellaceae bacterium]|nr:alpha/beta fold hydrolase [Lewinellaceae bacterium]